jgi:hypothetical protein
VIKADGLAWCVGQNNFSMLTNDGGDSSVDTAVLFGAETAGAIAVGPSHSCYVADTTGTIRCAGFGTEGRLGDGQDTTSATLVIATTDIIK